MATVDGRGWAAALVTSRESITATTSLFMMHLPQLARSRDKDQSQALPARAATSLACGAAARHPLVQGLDRFARGGREQERKECVHQGSAGSFREGACEAQGNLHMLAVGLASRSRVSCE